MATGELPGIAVRLFGEADALEQRPRLRLGRFPRQPAGLHGGERDIAEHGHVGKEVVALEHHADLLPQLNEVPLAAVDGFACHGHLSALDGLECVQAA